MFHHVAMFRFHEDVDAAIVEAIRNELLELPGHIPEIRSYAVGRDAGLREGTWDMVVLASFDDAAGYQEYRDHPRHRPLVDRILSIASDRAALQSSELA